MDACGEVLNLADEGWAREEIKQMLPKVQTVATLVFILISLLYILFSPYLLSISKAAFGSATLFAK